MKKKCFYLFAMMMAVISANAQNEVGQVTLKPMVGINFSTMTNTDDSKIRIGAAIGAEAECGVANSFGISVGALYSMQGVKGSEGLVDLTVKTDYLNIPILANYYPVKGFAIKAGIQPAFKISAKAKADVSSGSVSASAEEDLEGVKGFYLSIPIGLSYEISNFVLDARYNLGVTKALDWEDSKHSVFQVILGYKFSL